MSGRCGSVCLAVKPIAAAFSTFQPLGEDKVPSYPTAWLPTARVAERWQWLVTEKP